MDPLHRKVSMATGILPAVATLEQQVDLILERNSELEIMVARMTAEQAKFIADVNAAIEEVAGSMVECEIKPTTVHGLFAIFRQNLFNRRRK